MKREIKKHGICGENILWKLLGFWWVLLEYTTRVGLVPLSISCLDSSAVLKKHDCDIIQLVILF